MKGSVDVVAFWKMYCMHLALMIEYKTDCWEGMNTLFLPIIYPIMLFIQYDLITWGECIFLELFCILVFLYYPIWFFLYLSLI